MARKTRRFPTATMLPPTGRGTRRSRLTSDDPFRRQGFQTFRSATVTTLGGPPSSSSASSSKRAGG